MINEIFNKENLLLAKFITHLKRGEVEKASEVVKQNPEIEPKALQWMLLATMKDNVKEVG